MEHSAKPVRSIRDPEATKAQILEAAEEEFARYGLGGTRIEAIAAKTGVTKAMIYYYFESKEGLYQTVMQRLVTELNQMFQQLDLEQLPAKAALEKAVAAAIAYEAANPRQGMLWFHEAIQNQGKYGGLTGWQESFWHLAKVLERGIAEGVFRPLDPFLTTINIIAICSFYFDAQENLKYLLPEQQLLSPQMLERHCQEAMALILSGVLLP